MTSFIGGLPDFGAALPLQVIWSFLVTYLLHSTIIVITLLAITRLIRQNRQDLHDLLWKIAIPVALVTSLIQLNSPLRPITGHLHLAVLPAAPESIQPAFAAGDYSGPVPTDSYMRRSAYQNTTRIRQSHQIYYSRESSAETIIIHQATKQSILIEPPSRQAPSEVAIAAGNPPVNGFWVSQFLIQSSVLIWLVFSLLLLTRLIYRHWTLHLKIKDRVAVTDPALWALLSDIRKDAGWKRQIRITQTDRLNSPVALGFREICLPKRVLNKLNRHQQKAIIAHELRHLLRGDPYWLRLSAIWEALLFFQPLHYLVRYKHQEAAEYLCDNWAVKYTRQPYELAKCLTAVAGWIQEKPRPILSYTAGISAAGKSLKQRITRIIENSETQPGISLYRSTLIAAAMITVFACSAPSISAISAQSPQPEIVSGLLQPTRQMPRNVQYWIQYESEYRVWIHHESKKGI